MKLLKRIIFIGFLFLPSLGVPGNRTQIAVLNLETPALDAGAGLVLSDRLRSELVGTGAFRVIEREKMNTILREQGFQRSGCTSDACAVEIGKILNISKICAGSVGRVGSIYTVNLRLIDVHSGEIMISLTADCEGPVETLLTETMKKLAAELAGVKTTPPEEEKFVIGDVTDETAAEIRPSRSKAMIRSVFFPGAGQHYQNKSFSGFTYNVLFAGSVIASILYDKQLDQKSDQYLSLRKSYREAYSLENIIKYRELVDKKYKELDDLELRRNIAIGISGTIWIWSFLDCWLLPPEFNKDKGIKVTSGDDYTGVQLQIHF